MDVLVPTTGPVDAQAIHSAKKLKLIVQPATGYSNIDIEMAAELDVPVCNSPGDAAHSSPVTLPRNSAGKCGGSIIRYMHT